VRETGLEPLDLGPKPLENQGVCFFRGSFSRFSWLLYLEHSWACSVGRACQTLSQQLKLGQQLSIFLILYHKSTYNSMNIALTEVNFEIERRQIYELALYAE